MIRVRLRNKERIAVKNFLSILKKMNRVKVIAKWKWRKNKRKDGFVLTAQADVLALGV